MSTAQKQRFAILMIVGIAVASATLAAGATAAFLLWVAP
jgi:hypothetical protein